MSGPEWIGYSLTELAGPMKTTGSCDLEGVHRSIKAAGLLNTYRCDRRYLGLIAPWKKNEISLESKEAYENNFIDGKKSQYLILLFRAS